MKTININKTISALLVAVAIGTVTSCSLDTEVEAFEGEKPASIAAMEYLNDYAALNSYVDRAKYPNVKVACALAASDYNAKNIYYRLGNANFDEFTAGNAMKYSSIVSDNGTMDFSVVNEFVDNAIEAGKSVYGHTLAWHSQQNNKYLGSLIAGKQIEIDPNEQGEVEDANADFTKMSSYPYYVMGYEPTFDQGWLHSENPGGWYQYFVLSDFPTTPGTEYKVTALMRASEAGSFNVQMGNWGATNEASISIGTDWEEKSVSFTTITTDQSFVVFQPGTFEGAIDIKWVKVTHGEAPVAEYYVNQVTNGEMNADASMASFIVREPGQGDREGEVLVGQGPDGKNCTKVTSAANPTNSWDTQFFIHTPSKQWAAGEEYYISFWYKASEDAAAETQCHGAPGSYMHWQMLSPNPSFTTEWQHYERKGTIPAEGNGMQSIAFNLSVNPASVTYYIADVQWSTIESGSTIPLTDEEKKDTLTWAMNRWIRACMENTAGKVLAWDAVNEAIAGGGDDGEGFYPLQSANNPDDNGVNGDVFYWQDFLGPIDYVRTVINRARQYNQEFGGDPSQLKLFINDYNLESDWDNNKKLRSLIHWIERWEADGKTRIDGIGTQMHISCYENEQTQASKKQHITKMFELMAATGKLIKISELDMGYVDAQGNTVLTANMTEQQHLAMKDLYRFVISEYLRIIPAAQQYAITQWCTTDSPTGSGWRAGQPTGLWTEDYSRKHTYAGFADGLKGE